MAPACWTSVLGMSGWEWLSHGVHKQMSNGWVLLTDCRKEKNLTVTPPLLCALPPAGSACASRPCTTCVWAWGRWARSSYDCSWPAMNSSPWRSFCFSAQVGALIYLCPHWAKPRLFPPYRHVSLNPPWAQTTGSILKCHLEIIYLSMQREFQQLRRIHNSNWLNFKQWY